MDGTNSVVCTVKLEWTNPQGAFLRKVNYKRGELRILRNEMREMFVEVTSEKVAPIKLHISGIKVHNKFMNEGKASIHFQNARCLLYISNAPIAPLVSFLRTIVVKLGNDKNKPGNTSLRTQLLSGKAKQYDEISPVTIVELEKAKLRATKGTETTPSPGGRKRKLKPESASKGSAAKRLYSSPNLEEPLTIEQKDVLEACMAGFNVFFTGSAGTGKSYLLRKIISQLPPDTTVATASTGVAACHIGGITLHQFAGIGKGEASIQRSYELASRTSALQIWRKCKHLIIDEISMIEGNYFEKVEAVARMIRKNDKPFGGIQLVLCGDFFQLPPVFKNNENRSSNSQHKVNFCFQTKAWDLCVQKVFELQQVHRQTDQEFIDLLNKIRIGHVPQEIADKLLSTSKQKIEKDGILATRLCSHTQDANIINESKLKALSGEEKTFLAQDSENSSTRDLDMQTPVPGKLILKVGAQVMLLKNINIASGLVNGARGVVRSFQDGLPVVRLRNRDYVAKHERWTVKTASGHVISRRQVPLRLAWAFSIHKSQGLTLDCVEMSLSRVFEAGQAYVALSRAQSLHTLRVLDFKASQVWANPDVLDFYERMRRNVHKMEFIALGKKRDSGGGVRVNKVKPFPKILSSKPLMSIS